jgi:hypothetical protein
MPNDAAGDFVERSRVSALAIASLVFGILCCIPGFGLIGTILGASSIIGISRSEGRVSGRGFAMTGLVLGLIGSLFWIAAVFGVSIAMNRYAMYGPAVKAFQTSAPATARGTLSTSAAAKVSDEQAREFGEAVTRELGAYQGTPKGLLGWWNDYVKVSQDLQQAMNGPSGRNSGAFPMPIHFEKGVALVIFYPGDGSGPNGMPPIKNISVHAHGKVLWLLPLEGEGAPPGSGSKPALPSRPSEPPATKAEGSGSDKGAEKP